MKQEESDKSHKRDATIEWWGEACAAYKSKGSDQPRLHSLKFLCE